METRTVKILKDTVAGGKDIKKNKTIELSLREAHTLVSIGRAEYVDRMVEPVGKPASEKATGGK